MPVMNMIQALNNAHKIAMKRDPRVVVLGEDVGKLGGVFRVTVDLQKEFGEDRVIDTPLSEGGIMGAAIGMALYGLRPIPEMQFSDFIYPAFDQIVNEAAKMRYRSGGQWSCPMVIRTPYGGGIRGGHYHSQSPEAYFVHTAGLKVVIPSDPHNAKGLFLSALEEEDPVLFLEPKRIYRASKAEVPEEEYTLPLGKAAIARAGGDVTLLAYGSMLHEALDAAGKAAEQGIECEVVDLRTLSPLDEETVLSSVRKTGRVVIVHEAPRTCGYGAELAALIAERELLSLEAPVRRVTGWDTPFPHTLENEYLPLSSRILPAIVETARF